MQQQDYRGQHSDPADDQGSIISSYLGAPPGQSLPLDVLKEPPQSRLSIILWGDRRKRLARQATRTANLNQGQPEWYQAFFVLWVAFYVLTINIGTISLWMIGGYLVLSVAGFYSQYQRRDPNRIPIHPKPMSGWLLLISYFVLIIPPLFLHGYVWRLPVLASYCLLDLWLIETGGYTRDPIKPNKSSTRWQGWYSFALVIATLAIIYVAFTTAGTIWPFIIYCAAALSVIILTRPKKDNPSPNTSSSAPPSGYS